MSEEKPRSAGSGGGRELLALVDRIVTMRAKGTSLSCELAILEIDIRTLATTLSAREDGWQLVGYGAWAQGLPVGTRLMRHILLEPYGSFNLPVYVATHKAPTAGEGDD